MTSKPARLTTSWTHYWIEERQAGLFGIEVNVMACKG